MAELDPPHVERGRIRWDSLVIGGKRVVAILTGATAALSAVTTSGSFVRKFVARS